MKTKVVIGVILVSILAIVVTYITIFKLNIFSKHIMVNGESMAPTLKNGSIVSYKKVDEINRFDIVVIKLGDDTVIKRVYGLPNEKIEIYNGKIYINDELTIDKYAADDASNNDATILDNDEYFVLGDNRHVSLDSRNIGPIKKENIMGVVIN